MGSLLKTSASPKESQPSRTEAFVKLLNSLCNFLIFLPPFLLSKSPCASDRALRSLPLLDINTRYHLVLGEAVHRRCGMLRSSQPRASDFHPLRLRATPPNLWPHSRQNAMPLDGTKSACLLHALLYALLLTVHSQARCAFRTRRAQTRR